MLYLFDKLVTEGASGPKRFDLERHILLGLGVKGRILDEAVDEDPYMSLDVEWLQVHPSLVLLLSSLK